MIKIKPAERPAFRYILKRLRARAFYWRIGPRVMAQGRYQLGALFTPRRLATAVAALFILSAAAAWADEVAAENGAEPFEATREWVLEAALAQGLYPAGMAVAPAEVWEPYAEALVALEGWDLEGAEKALRRTRDNAGRDAERIAVNHAFAELYFKKADLKKARKYADEALKLARAERDKKAESYVLKDLAKIERMGGNVPKAVEYSRRGYDLSAELQDPTLRAYFLMFTAEAEIEFGNYERGEACLEEAAPIFEEYGAEWAMAYAAFLRGFLQVERGEYEVGKEAMGSALETFRKGGDRHAEAQVRVGIGYALMQQDDYGAALQEFMPALQIYRDLDDRACEAKALYFCAQVFLKWKQYDSALTAAEEASEISREYGMSALLTLCTVQRGVLSLASGDLKGAEKSFKDARKLFKKTKDPAGERACDWALALFYVAQGESDKALEKLEDLERRCEEAGDRTLLAATYVVTAEAYEGKLGMKSSRAYRAKLVALCEKEGNDRGLAAALSQEGYTFLKCCYYDRALECNRRAIALYAKYGDDDGAAFNYRGSGVCYMRTGKYDDAKAAFEKAAELHHKLGDQFELGKDYLYSGILAEKAGNNKDKAKFMMEARRLIDDKKTVNSILTLENAFTTAEKAGMKDARIYVLSVGGKTVIVIGDFEP
jgi:tetratricopeptide (TPR) repeat protein